MESDRNLQTAIHSVCHRGRVSCLVLGKSEFPQYPLILQDKSFPLVFFRQLRSVVRDLTTNPFPSSIAPMCELGSQSEPNPEGHIPTWFLVVKNGCKLFCFCAFDSLWNNLVCNTFAWMKTWLIPLYWLIRTNRFCYMCCNLSIVNYSELNITKHLSWIFAHILNKIVLGSVCNS